MALLQIGTSVAIPFNFDGKSFNSWVGTTKETSTGPNYLGLLTLGWCYVLSARLIEIHGDNATMQYKKSEAEHDSENLPELPKKHVIDIGEVNEEVARWWSAILAQQEGWEGIIKQDSKQKFLTPWTVSRTCRTVFVIKQRRSSLASKHTPLSSKRAFEALAEFALLHGLGSQFPISLAIALTFPAHRYYGSTIQLPFPCSANGKKPTTPTDAIPPMWARLKDDLPFYITLSCSPEVLMSALCGSFWEPEVPCNLVSPWLHPVLKEVQGEASAASGYDQEILALMGAIRRPNLSALWIGAIASGLGPKILQKVGRGRPPLDPLAHPWIGYPQSFMDIAGSGPYTCENPEYISRADVWRLLHLPLTEQDDFRYMYGPCTPWAPCGASLTRNCALRVISHLECPRHEYEYDHWTWELADGVIIQDYGLSRSFLSNFPENEPTAPTVKDLKDFEKKGLDQMASREASLEVFRWFSINGEGVPPENIYKDDWLQEIWEESSADMVDEADDHITQRPLGQSEDQIESWLTKMS
ncbi:hypothetical protein N7488_011825 [Penicillium malachiteum]|nr:hypothetical protein N7488_011825 [Penicillium malachiteum]